MKRSLPTKAVLAISFVLTVLIVGVMVYALVDNNNQGEVYDTITGAVDWPYIIKVVVVLFAVTFAITTAAIFVIRGVMEAVRR